MRRTALSVLHLVAARQMRGLLFEHKSPQFARTSGDDVTRPTQLNGSIVLILHNVFSQTRQPPPLSGHVQRHTPHFSPADRLDETMRRTGCRSLRTGWIKVCRPSSAGAVLAANGTASAPPAPIVTCRAAIAAIAGLTFSMASSKDRVAMLVLSQQSRLWFTALRVSATAAITLYIDRR